MCELVAVIIITATMMETVALQIITSAIQHLLCYHSNTSLGEGDHITNDSYLFTVHPHHIKRAN